MLTAQYLCLLKLELPEEAQLLKDPYFKARFVALATEEQNRRSSNTDFVQKMIADKLKLEAILVANKEFFDVTFGRRKLEIEKLHEVKDSDIEDLFEKYENEARNIRTKLGYDTQMKADFKADNFSKKMEEQKVENVSFEDEVSKCIASKPWENKETGLLLKKCNDHYLKNNQDLELMAKLLGKDKEMSQISRLAMIIQNGAHSKNS